MPHELFSASNVTASWHLGWGMTRFVTWHKQLSNRSMMHEVSDHSPHTASRSSARRSAGCWWRRGWRWSGCTSTRPCCPSRKLTPPGGEAASLAPAWTWSVTSKPRGFPLPTLLVQFECFCHWFSIFWFVEGCVEVGERIEAEFKVVSDDTARKL